ncbi:hypothetical protein AB0C51_03495 [Streptomyces pathocidini]|uniref:hypothetical protein n=1 Tax=Streptomyces pathocidini TaxID=1650571 RepID=UPI0033F61AB1
MRKCRDGGGLSPEAAEDLEWISTKPAAVSKGPDQLDVFARASDNTLEHWKWTQWIDGFHWDREEHPQGTLASAPTAFTTSRRYDVFARGTDHSLQWWFEGSISAAPVHQSVEEGGWLVHDPVAVLSGAAEPVSARTHVLSLSVEGPLRHWSVWHDGGVWDGPAHVGMFLSDAAALSRGVGWVDIFAKGTNNNHLEHLTWSDRAGPGLSPWSGPEDLEGDVASRPVAVSWAADRIDVFARNPQDRLLHWGWDGRLRRWFKAEPPSGLESTVMTADPEMVSWGANRLDMFVRTEGRELHHWWWDAPNRIWRGPTTLGGNLASDPAALSRGPNRLDAFARTMDGALRHWEWNGTRWSEEVIAAPVFETGAPPWEPVRADSDFLLERGSDLLCLGVRWSGFQAVDPAPGGGPGRLEPLPGGQSVVFLTFPPQHIAEETTPAQGPLAPSSGSGVWQSRLSGPSQVAFTTDRPIDLTVEGMLAALAHGRILPTEDLDTKLTAIELPWRLLLSPKVSADDGSAPARVSSDHPVLPVTSPAGDTGLWRARLRADGSSGQGAGLPVRALTAGNVDAVPNPALPAASRQSIVQQPEPASAERLELSALGGSLSARGAWETFSWEHEATLGRDQRVLTVQKGVLYPFGHRAEYAEFTERLINTQAGEPVAALRKKRILTVTEPVRGAVENDPRLARAFPFTEVELTRRVFTDLSDPDWDCYERQIHDPMSLDEERQQLQLEADRLLEEVHGGDMGYHGGPVVEDLADTQEAAARFLALYEAITRIEEQIAAAGASVSGFQLVPVYFWPRTRGAQQLVRFPVRCAGDNGDVHLELPLLFVADQRLPETSLLQEFTSLESFEVAQALGDEYQAQGAGLVPLPGTPIALVPAEQRMPSDVQEVYRVNIKAAREAVRGFRPQLADFLVGMPSLRTLMGSKAPPELASPVSLAFAQEYLEKGEQQVDVALRTSLPGATIPVDFTKAADRAGGLVSPQIAADGISRLHGPISMAGLPSVPNGPLDPSKVFGDAATLLGFRIRDLIRLDKFKNPPSITTEVRDGQPPVVTMKWEGVELQKFPPFYPSDTTRLHLVVTAAPDATKTTCSVNDFTLRIPQSGSPVLELSFRLLKFTSEAGQEPKLTVEGVSASFRGVLELLKKLQEQVKLGDNVPRIKVSTSGAVAEYGIALPTVATGGFILKNISFGAGVDVPFDGRAVSISLGFASREKPFNLSVLLFGGGGYIDLKINKDGIQRLEASLEFGAAFAVDFVVASGEVHAMGGVRYVMERGPGGQVALTGFIRIGGSVEILGLISVSVELRVELRYDFTRNQMIGRAKLVVEIDLTLYSDSVEIDSGDWVLAGNDAAAALGDSGLDAWIAYRKAFTP